MTAARGLNGSEGIQAARMMEQLGMPSNMAEMAGAHIDEMHGDVEGVQRLMLAASRGLTTTQMDAVFGKGMATKGFVPRPRAYLNDNLDYNNLRGYYGVGGASREAPFGTGQYGRSVERAMNQDYLFHGMLDRQLGGTVLPDGRNDGILSVYRSPYNQVGGLMQQGINQGMMPAGGLASVLAGLALPMAGLLGGNPMASGILRGMMRMEGNIAGLMYEMAGNPTGAAKARLMNDPGAWQMANGMGVDLRNASFEDILFLLLMKYAKKKEDDILRKVQMLDQSNQTASANPAGQWGGILGTMAGVAGAGFGLAAGGPMGMMAGQAVAGGLGQGIGGMLQNFSVGGAGGLYGSNMGEGMDPSKMSDTMKQQMLQKLVGDLQKLYEMLSNIIKTMHDMQMTPVRNLRG